MALFEDFKKKANDIAQQAADLAQAGAARSRQLASVARLKAANLGEEDTIRKAYVELGKQYFAKYGEHPEDEFIAACTTIIEAQAAIAANNAVIEELLAKDIEEEAPVEEAPAGEEPVAEAEEEEAGEAPEAPVEETPAEEVPVAEEPEAEAEEEEPEAPAEEEEPKE